MHIHLGLVAIELYILHYLAPKLAIVLAATANFCKNLEKHEQLTEFRPNAEKIDPTVPTVRGSERCLEERGARRETRVSLFCPHCPHSRRPYPLLPCSVSRPTLHNLLAIADKRATVPAKNHFQDGLVGVYCAAAVLSIPVQTPNLSQFATIAVAFVWQLSK